MDILPTVTNGHKGGVDLDNNHSKPGADLMTPEETTKRLLHHSDTFLTCTELKGHLFVLVSGYVC